MEKYSYGLVPVVGYIWSIYGYVTTCRYILACRLG